MSVFLAIDPDDTVRAETAAVLEHWRSTDARWQRAEKLHVTLVFLGNPDAAAVDAWSAQLRPFAQAYRPFSLRLQGAGLFETARAPEVLWLGVEGTLAPLRALQHDAEHLLTPAASPRPYVPHLTLARARRPQTFGPAVEALQSFRSSTFEVRHLTLYESTHHTWRALERFALR